MKQYIDKSIIIAEIERRLKEYMSYPNYQTDSNYMELCEILSFINTFESKDVDLDLEITLWANAIPEIRLDDIERLAKYFFELGLAQKENNK